VEKPIEIEPQKAVYDMQNFGFLHINETADAGEYILQVIVRDKLANRTTSQWIDFEVVK
jgi:hypothetical protein